MLIQLYGRNFRSFRDEFRLSMVACDFKNEEESNRGTMSFDIEGFDEPLELLRCAAIYGANGSGKSNLLRAASAINWLTTESSRQSEPDGSIPPYEPFKLDRTNHQKPVMLGCDLVYGHVVLRYEVEYDHERIVREKMSTLGKNELVLIERTGDDPIEGELISGSKPNSLYVKDMQNNVTVLSKLAQHGASAKGKKSAIPFYKSIVSATSHRDYSRAVPHIFLSSRRFNDDDYKNWIFNHLIKPSDLGINDIIIKEIPYKKNEIEEIISRSMPDLKIPDTHFDISFTHGSFKEQSINLEDESFGTRKMFAMSDAWWRLAHERVSIFADEVSAGLHPKLLDRIVRAVNSPASVGQNSQMIFTTHDTGLMDKSDAKMPALRRDQIFFTKKDQDGSSQLYSLPEFKENARTVHNIRKRYLSGVYGAVPMPEEVSL